MARMLGSSRQPFCGKCCGDHTKAVKQITKRAARSHENQEIREIKREVNA